MWSLVLLPRKLTRDTMAVRLIVQVLGSVLPLSVASQASQASSRVMGVSLDFGTGAGEGDGEGAPLTASSNGSAPWRCIFWKSRRSSSLSICQRSVTVPSAARDR